MPSGLKKKPLAFVPHDQHYACPVTHPPPRSSSLLTIDKRTCLSEASCAETLSRCLTCSCEASSIDEIFVCIAAAFAAPCDACCWSDVICIFKFCTSCISSSFRCRSSNSDLSLSILLVSRNLFFSWACLALSSSWPMRRGSAWVRQR